MEAPESRAAGRLTIGQVVEQLTAEFPDITHSSLRFLEREGLIAPDRTGGGHRLFPRAQVERIRTIKRWQRERLSLEEIRERLARADVMRDTDAIAAELLEHLVAGDLASAQRVVIGAAELGLPLATIFDSILAPVLRETGDRWASGDFSVGQEKEISALVRDLIAQLSGRRQPDIELHEPAIIAACVDGEYHELGLRMVTALLRERGLPVLYLGPSVAADFLVERTLARHARAVLLSATQQARRPALIEAVTALGAIDATVPHPLIFVGGGGAPGQDAFPDARHVNVVEHEDLKTSARIVADALRGSRALNETG